MFNFDIGCATDVGNRRKINQDRIIVFGDSDSVLSVIADGMGGMSYGEKASQIVADDMEFWWQKNNEAIMSVPENVLIDMLFEKINNINQRIVNYGKKNNIRTGTTMTLLFIRNGRGIFVYCGDSRLYRIRDDSVLQMTEDETLYIYNEKNNIAGNSEKNKSILLSYIGKSENLVLNIQTINICKNDIYMLCTDGFYNYLNMYDNENVSIMKIFSAQKAVDMLVERVKKTRAADNLSAIVIKHKQNKGRGDI